MNAVAHDASPYEAASAALPLGSGDLMGVNANIAHSGGLLGSDGLPSRQVDMGVFAGARRFHTGGLVSGEVPIIARQGEAVPTWGSPVGDGAIRVRTSDIKRPFVRIDKGEKARIIRLNRPAGETGI